MTTGAFLLAALVYASACQAGEPVEIDVSTIIADGVGGTKKIGNIKPIGLMEVPLYTSLEESRTWAATKCFVVGGHNGVSVANVRNAFRNDVGVRAVVEKGETCSLVFFVKPSPFYFSIERVAVLDGVIEIDYLASSRFSQAGKYLAIVPLPPLSAGDWLIKPQPLPLSRVSTDLAANQQYAEGYAKMLNEAVKELIAGEGKFRVVDIIE